VEVLAGYPPQVGQRILGPEYDYLAALRLDLSGLPVREADPSAGSGQALADATDQIRVHLNTLAQALSPSEALPVMLDQVSGHLVAEFKVLQMILKAGDATVDADLVRQVQQKFAPVHDQLEQGLADLDLLVTLPRPPQPDTDGTWTTDEWLEQLLGDRIRLVETKAKGIDQVLREKPQAEPEEPFIPPPELIAELEKMLRQWIDDSIPALGGLTPREAVKTPEGRQQVLELIDYAMQMQKMMPKTSGTFAPDYRKVKKMLGLG